MLHLDCRSPTRRAWNAALVGAAFLFAVASHAFAQGIGGVAPAQTPEPAWKSSPYHGVIGGDGNVIPCRCIYRGQSYRLGEKVCMNTHVGTVMTECDLQLNNTSWVPTSEACTVS